MRKIANSVGFTGATPMRQVRRPLSMSHRSFWSAFAGAVASAYNFNLYEHDDAFAVQLVGTLKFDPDDPDWACEESFSSGEDLFEIPHASVGNEWRAGLDAAKSLIASYMQTGIQPGLLRSSRAVGVGFVDGDLELLHVRSNT